MNTRRSLLPVAFVVLTAGILTTLGTVSGQESSASAGASTRPATPFKIGVVNTEEVFQSYDKQADEYARLRNERDRRQTDLDRLAEEIKAAEQDYEANKDTMSESKRFEAEEEINAAVNRYKSEFKRLQGDIDRMEKGILERLFRDLDEAVATVGDQENYHLIFESGDKRGSSLLFSSPTLNMTPRVIEFLNTEYDKEKTAGHDPS